MKKIAVALLTAVISVLVLCPVTKARAQEEVLQPEVLAVTTSAKLPTPLPRVLTGKDINFSDKVNQDLVVFSSNASVGSSVNGNLFIAGGSVKIDGIVTENLFAAGGDVSIKGEVKKNVIVAGGNVTIEKGAHVVGYLISAGGQVNILGKVDGEVRAAGGTVTVGDESVLGGTLLVDAGDISVSDMAKVGGQKKLNLIKTEKPEETKNQISRFWGFFSIIGFVGKIILLLVLVRLFGSHITKATDLAKKTFWSSLLLGFAKLILTPLIIVLMMVTIIGMPIAMATVFVYVGAMALAKFVSAAVLGRMFVLKGWLKNDNLYVQAVLGLLALEVVGMIPLVGGLVSFAAFLLGLGLIVRWEMAAWSGKKKV